MRAGAGGDEPLTDLNDTWIPNRNGVFINAAAAFAESYGCDTVVTGFNRDEAEEFPDNGRDYVERINGALALSTRNGVTVTSDTIDLGKREIILEGMEVGAPLSVIWSCYRSGERMCGRCASCRRLRLALIAVPADRRPVLEFETED
jgi:7-cyano-7-deazaguanine synthase